MHTQPQMPQVESWERGARMPGSTQPCTAVLPWYEEADFAELLAISDHGVPSQESYGRWYRSAMQTVDDLLREGKAIEFVTVRPAAYFAWLRERPNTLETRLRYAKYLATASDAAAA